MMRDSIGRQVMRERLRQDALAAWNDYQTTGLHLTEEEADAWLCKLENGEDVEVPACHI
jgi:predicted transcriptional regulator